MEEDDGIEPSPRQVPERPRVRAGLGTLPTILRGKATELNRQRLQSLARGSGPVGHHAHCLPWYL